MAHIQSIKLGLESGINCISSRIIPVSRTAFRFKQLCAIKNINDVCHSGQPRCGSNIIDLWNRRLISTGPQLLCTAKENPSAPPEPISEEESSGSNSVKSPAEDSLEKELREKIELLSKDVLDFKDKYQRSLADRENLRVRLEKQISDSKLYGIQSFCKDLLEVSDVFRKAIESVPEENVKTADPVFVGLYNGVVMTEKELLAVFRRHGLKRIIPVEGDKFDPSEQEAMFEVPGTEETTPGTVAHIVRTGWKLHERCVRSAQVGVFK